MGVKAIVGSFIAGVLMTLALLLVVPPLLNQTILPYVEQMVGNTEFYSLTSDVITQMIVTGIMLIFMYLLGAGGVLRTFGVPGILGLICAYWLMGDVKDAILPLLILSAMLIISWNRNHNKEKKAKENKD